MFKRFFKRSAAPASPLVLGNGNGSAQPSPPPPSLIERINCNGDINSPATPRPLVTLEEFFEGNNDPGSIGYNFYPDQPRPGEFYELFKQIRDHPEVSNVLVEVSQHEAPEEWPSTDTVWII